VASSRLWVDTDPTVLRRILVNLVSNAVRYTSRGRVLIGCRPRGPEVEFQVWDSGIGIPPEQREAIFEEFFQIGQSTAARHESHGLGLGLSIVKRSARLLHAPLDLRSIPGRGSMFSIRVPRCPPPEPTTEITPEASYPQSQARLGVLVIDDDEQVLAAMRSVLGVWGHRVFCATSPDEAAATSICSSPTTAWAATSPPSTPSAPCTPASHAASPPTSSPAIPPPSASSKPPNSASPSCTNPSTPSPCTPSWATSAS